MNTLTTLSSLAAHPYGGYGPGPWFLLFPLTFWLLLVVAGVLLARRRRRWSGGEGTLADVFARGEITEAEYRARLAVLRETRK